MEKPRGFKWLLQHKDERAIREQVARLTDVVLDDAISVVRSGVRRRMS